MAETFKQYTSRLLSYSSGKNPIQIQQSTPEKVKRLLKGLKKSQILKRHSAGKWSIAEILAHLSEGEIVVAYRLRTIINSNGTPIQAYDQNSWVNNSFYLKHHPKEALDLFTVIRKNNVALLKSLPKKFLDFHGIHSERGKESVAHIMNMVAGHDINHLRGISETIRQIRKV